MLSVCAGAAGQLKEPDRSPGHEEFQAGLEKSIDSIFLYSSIIFKYDQGTSLTEKDFVEVANELGVEVAAIKAIVEIEAGKSLMGLTAEGEPLVNYSANSFVKNARRLGVDISRAKKEHPKAFTRPARTVAENYERLSEAMAVDTMAAVASTYWGMFQIGGFNYKLCGTDTPGEFARLMSRSEHDQLRLFANFLRNCGMVDAVRGKNWHKFARMYNGPSYYKRGYHTRLANAYKKYK